jgi:hypothetical protein
MILNRAMLVNLQTMYIFSKTYCVNLNNENYLANIRERVSLTQWVISSVYFCNQLLCLMKMSNSEPECVLLTSIWGD